MNQPWRQIQVTVPAALAEDVRLLMQRRAGRAVAVEDGYCTHPPDESLPNGSCRVTAWFSQSDAAADALLADLWMAGGLDAPSLRSVRESCTDRASWRAREALYQRPVIVGRMVIVPPAAGVPEGVDPNLVLAIDSAGAFGSGLHASTRGVLQLLQALDLAGKRVLDVGTGTGVLAIAAARLGAAAAIGIDIDAEAVALAGSNIERNRCAALVTAQHAELSADWLGDRARFDVVIANITAAAHCQLLPAYSRAAAGPLLLSGIYRPRMPKLTLALDAVGWASSQTLREGDWVTLLCERAGPATAEAGA